MLLGEKKKGVVVKIWSALKSRLFVYLVLKHNFNIEHKQITVQVAKYNDFIVLWEKVRFFRLMF